MEVVSGDNWSYKRCKVPVKSSSSTNQHPTFYNCQLLILNTFGIICTEVFWDVNFGLGKSFYAKDLMLIVYTQFTLMFYLSRSDLLFSAFEYIFHV